MLLLAGAGTNRNLVNDAHLAAISIEHRGSVISDDSDFARFACVTWRQPRVAFLTGRHSGAGGLCCLRDHVRHERPRRVPVDRS